MKIGSLPFVFPENCSMVLLGPPGTGKNRFVESIIISSVKDEYECLILLIDRPPREFVEDLITQKATDEQIRHLSIIDGYSRIAGEESSERFETEVRAPEVSIAVHKALQEVKPKLFIWNSISASVFYESEDEILPVALRSMARVKAADALGIYMVTEGSHSEGFQRSICASADCVIRLIKRDIDYRTFREIELQKLRRMTVEQERFCYTLADGFKIISQFSWTPANSLDISEPVSDVERYYSTGSSDFDKLLGGGIPESSYCLLDLKENFPPKALDMIVWRMVFNTLLNGNCVAMLPPIEMTLSAGPYENVLKEFADRVGVFRFGRRDTPMSPVEVSVKGESFVDDYEVYWEFVDQMIERTQKPVITIMAQDALEARYGPDDPTRFLGRAITKIRDTKGARVNITKPGLKVNERIRNMADIYLVLFERYGSIFLYGKKPRTGIYAIEPVQPNERIIPTYRLIPVR